MKITPRKGRIEIMNKRQISEIENMSVWALAVIGWVYVLAELVNSWNAWNDGMLAGIAPTLNEAFLLTFAVFLYGSLSAALPVAFVHNTIDMMTEYKKSKATKIRK